MCDNARDVIQATAKKKCKMIANGGDDAADDEKTRTAVMKKMRIIFGACGSTF